MRILAIIMLFLFSTTSFAAGSYNSVDMSKQLPNTLPRGETTKLNYTNTETQIGTSGTATCPTGQIMVGLKVTYVGAAFTYIGGSKITSTCRDAITGTSWSFRTNNWNPALLTDPTRLTYHIICRDVNVDFF